MSRPKKQKIEVSSAESLQSVIQEVYNNACHQMTDAQKIVNVIDAAATPVDVDDLTKLAKSKTDALKLKDSAIKIKLDIGKLQSDVIKHSGNVKAAVDNNPELVSNENFDAIRDMLRKDESKN
tara:strand:- start:6167 stop:6535 length:369 start_codon:yes stop_codon:yes gene_type:complete